MVLKYSKLMFVYFSSEPFTTVKSIEAHKYAFRFFGGYPKNIVYDQDRVFVVHENFGNIILVKEFEDYVKDVGFSVVVCSGYHPERKGTVENYVKIVKSEFLLGRVYTGIDCLNSSCLELLDNRSSDVVHSSTGKTAQELFMKEAKHLTKIAYNLDYSRFIYNNLNAEGILRSMFLSFGMVTMSLKLTVFFKEGEQINEEQLLDLLENDEFKKTKAAVNGPYDFNIINKDRTSKVQIDFDKEQRWLEEED